MIPVVYYVLSHSIMSQLVPFFAVQYGLFVTAIGVFIHSLCPTSDFWDYKRRGSIFYFLCCMFTVIATFLLTVQLHGLFSKSKSKLSENDVLYLKASYGNSAEILHAIFTVVMALLMIKKMDCCYSPRNLAMYWCGATITHEMIIHVALFFEKHLVSMYYSFFAHFFYIFAVALILRHFVLQHPRQDSKRPDDCAFTSRENILAAVLLAFSLLYTCLRVIGTGKASVKVNAVSTYTSAYESLITDNFGAAWVVVSAVWILPCCVLSLCNLFKNTPHKIKNVALLFAGSMLYGTALHLTYYVLFAIKTKPTKVAIGVAVTLNLLLVLGSHLHLYCAMPYLFHTLSPTPLCMMESEDDTEDDDEDDTEEEDDDDSADCLYKKQQ